MFHYTGGFADNLHNLITSSAVAEMGDRLAPIDMGRKEGDMPLWGAGSQSDTMWPGPRPTSMPSSVRENVCNNAKKRKKSCFLDFEKNVKTG